MLFLSTMSRGIFLLQKGETPFSKLVILCLVSEGLSDDVLALGGRGVEDLGFCLGAYR